MMKCSKCGEEKALTEFGKDRTRIRKNCKDCDRRRRKEWLAKHPERLEEYERRRAEKTSRGLRVNAPHTLIFVKTCEITGESFVTPNRNRRFSCSGYQLFKKTQVKDANKPRKRICVICKKSFLGTSVAKICSEECRASYRWNKHAKQRGLGGARFELIDRMEVFNKYNWHCAACGLRTPYEAIGTNAYNEPTVDHVTPLSQGGPHTYHNVQLLCRLCNTAKSDLLNPSRELIATTSMYYKLKQQINVTEQAIRRR